MHPFQAQAPVEEETFLERLRHIEETWGYTSSHYDNVRTLRPFEHLQLLESDLGIKDVASNFGDRIRALEIQVGLFQPTPQVPVQVHPPAREQFLVSTNKRARRIRARMSVSRSL